MGTPSGPVPYPDHIPSLLDHWGIRSIYCFLVRHWASLLFLASMTLVIISLTIVWRLLQDVRQVQQASCESVVANRTDLRLLLQDVLDVSTSPQSKAFFERELNEKLPALMCVDNKIVKIQP